MLWKRHTSEVNVGKIQSNSKKLKIQTVKTLLSRGMVSTWHTCT